MPELVSIKESTGPLIVSFPHSGTAVSEQIAQKFSASDRRLIDSVWHVLKRYGCLQQLPELLISANYCRYEIDLNRSNQRPETRAPP